MALITVITGTILATGKTFTHGLGTTPDFITVTGESTASATNVPPYSVLTFGTQTMTIAGPADSAAFRAKVEKIHSIIA